MKKSLICGLAVAAFAFTACDDDLDTITVTGLEAAELSYSSGDDLVLSSDKADEEALTLTWTDASELVASKAEVTLPSDLKSLTLEVYTLDDQGETYLSKSVSVSDGTKTFTHSELNVIVREIGVGEDEARAVYFCIASTLGDNVDPVYSNVLTLNITSYTIDLTKAYIYGSSDGIDLDGGVLGTLYSADEDGIYVGFYGASSWFNWYAMTGDGYIWGNESTDWTAFEVEQDGGNFWYPGTAGCYYTVLNTVDLEWSATLISELNLVDADGNTIAMTYSRTSNQWSAVINNSAAVEYSITGVTQYYDVNTGTDTGTDGTCSFGATGGTLTWGGTEALSVSSTGEQTIILALSDPTNLYYEIASGAVEEEEEVENLLEYDEATGVACKTVTTTLSGSDFVEILTADEVSTILGYTYDNVKVTISGITSSTTNWISVYSDTSWSNETGFGFWGNESTTCIYDITDNLSKYESTGMYMAGVVGDDEVTITISYLVTVSEGSYDASSAVQILTADQVSSLLGYDSITIKISGIESSEETWMSLISDTSWNNEISAGLWGYTNTEFAFTIDSATLANYTSDGIYLSGSSSCSAVTVYVTYNVAQ